MGSVPPPIGGENHAHRHDHDDGGLADIELRVRALESLMIEKGYVDPAALDAIVETYETKIGPRNGARVVARSWADPAFRRWLNEDATAAIQLARLCRAAGRAHDRGREHGRRPQPGRLHALLLLSAGRCSACRRSGTSPPPYRSRAVIDPRGVLAEFGVSLPASTKIRVWDSTAEIRYLVVPMRPAGTEGWSEERLAALVTRNSMIGAGLALGSARRSPREARHERRAGSRRHDGFRPGRAANRTSDVFHADWEKRALALTIAAGALGEWNIDMARHAHETLHPSTIWRRAIMKSGSRVSKSCSSRAGWSTPEELAASSALQPRQAHLVRRSPPRDVAPTLGQGNALRPPAGIPRALHGRRGGPHAQHQPKRTYPPAALCARQARPHRAGPRRFRLPRRQRPWSRPKPAMALFRLLPGFRALGPRRRSQPGRVDRRLGELSRRRCGYRSACSRLRQRRARDSERAEFREPWEAQAFALVVALHEARLFGWSEWTAALSREIHAPPGSDRRGRGRLLPPLARGARKPGRRKGRREPGSVGRARGGVGARRAGNAARSADPARQRSAGLDGSVGRPRT